MLPLEALGKTLFLASLASDGCHHSLACGRTTPVSAIFTSSVYSSLPLPGSYKDTVRDYV